MASVDKVTQVTDNRFLNYYELSTTKRTGEHGRYFMASRAAGISALDLSTGQNQPDGVVIFSLTGQRRDQVVLVRQYRYPIDEVTLEIPAGKLDVSGEDPLECAKRELSEETGYTAQEYKFLSKLATSVGFSDEVIYIYAAKGLKAGTQHTDEDEFINVVKVPLAEAVEMVLDGRINDGKSVTAIFMLDRMMNK